MIELITTLTHRGGAATVPVTHDRTHLAGVDHVVEIVDGSLSSLAGRR